jgi:hypothetical protein
VASSTSASAGSRRGRGCAPDEQLVSPEACGLGKVRGRSPPTRDPLQRFASASRSSVRAWGHGRSPRWTLPSVYIMITFVYYYNLFFSNILVDYKS